MKFELNKEILLEGLTKVGKVVNAKSVIPILSGILCEVKEEEIVLTGSDGTSTIVHGIPVDGVTVFVGETGKVVLPKQVIEIVKKLSKTISFNLEEGILKVSSEKSKFNLNCMDSEEYPRIPNTEADEPTLVLEGGQFRDFVNRTAFAASVSETRPVLQGVLCHAEGKNFKMVCTDSHRLGEVKQSLSNSSDVKVVIPAKALDTMSKVFNLDQSVELFANDNLLFLRNEQTIFSSRLIDGNYPDTSRLIPDNFKSVMVLNRKEFINSLELISGIAKGSDNSSGVAKLHVNGVANLSSTQAETGKGEVEMIYSSLEGEDEYTISFSIKYVIDALKAMESNEVEFKFTDAMRPFVLTPYQEDKHAFDELQLILPVRTY